MHPDIYGLEGWAERRARRLALLGYAIVITFTLLGCGLIIKAWQNALTDWDVPDLAVCSLQVVECGQWEPVVHNPAGLVGTASWYDYELASGWSSLGHRVAAVRHFPRGSLLKVTNLENGKSVVVRVTDYGPDASVHPDRVVDLSSYAFGLIADPKLGLAHVRVEVL